MISSLVNAVVSDFLDHLTQKQPEKRWYVIHTYSGYEKKVKTNLEHRIESMGMDDKIFQVLVPEEDEIEIRGGQRVTVQKKVYPGYVLVEMVLDPDSWFVVRNTPGVTSFVGGGNIPGSRNEPVPLEEHEVKQILRQMGVETPSTASHSRRARACVSRTARSPSSSARSTRSTPSATRSRCWSASSAARRPWSWTSSRSRSCEHLRRPSADYRPAAHLRLAHVLRAGWRPFSTQGPEAKWPRRSGPW